MVAVDKHARIGCQLEGLTTLSHWTPAVDGNETDFAAHLSLHGEKNSVRTHTRTHPHTNIHIELSGSEEHGIQSRSLAVFLNFRIPANSSSYPFDQTGVHDSSATCDFCTHFSNSLSSLKFQLSMFLKNLEILAWPFFATRQYCTVHIPCTPFKKKKSDQIWHAYSSNRIYFKNINKGSSHL